MATQTAETQETRNDQTDSDPTLSLIRLMVEFITGKPVRIFSMAEPAADAGSQAATADQSTQASAAPFPTATGPGLAFEHHVRREETEQLDLSTEGVINTADGRSISFRLDLTMSRHYAEQLDISLRTGSARRTDPLVLNFSGTGAQLSNQRVRFDLNGDGQQENVALLAEGNAYLALDRNNNGQIDNGLELFGPASNSGFAELARYDDDGNGWIDENDAVFKQLSLWTPDRNGGGTLESLAQKGVGALYLGQTRSPFELRGAGNQDLGAVTASGLYLSETGKAGFMQEIDLTV
ncbi:hypothetical protein B9N43_05060 [Denitratisoma sp. DHT3]|nr:hypothetical protein B9N43_05060 [Denitratisoma sp. DHT3]